jgi:hypothetical protein
VINTVRKKDLYARGYFDVSDGHVNNCLYK